MVIAALVASSCGARSGLDVDRAADARALDAGIDARRIDDVGIDATRDAACVDGRRVLDLERELPTILLVVDRSGSMGRSFGRDRGAPTRWFVLSSGLIEMVRALDPQTPLGIAMFPSGSADYCDTSGELLAPAVESADAVVAQILAFPPDDGSTPTADAIARAGDVLLALPPTTPRVMVLATDGGPACNEELDPRSCRFLGWGGFPTANRCLDDDRTAQRIAAYRDVGIPTYVLGITDEDEAVLSSVLDELARAGGRPRGGTYDYYAARSGDDVRQALASIRDEVGFCIFDTGYVEEPGVRFFLTIDGVEVPDETSSSPGWRWVDPAAGTLAVEGSWCESVRDGAELVAWESCID